MPISPARIAAFDVLLELERHGGHADELLHSQRLADLSEADRRLATAIVMGVLRWRSTLDDPIQQHSSKPSAKLDAEVLTALRIAAYQLSHLERIPASAAVNDSVALVKRARKMSAAAFVNAVLRKMVAEQQDGLKRFAEIRQLVKQAEAAREKDPNKDRLLEPVVVIPRPSDSEFVSRFANNYAHPEWLVERWLHEFGREAAAKICRYDQEVPATALHLFDPAAEDELRKAGVEVAPGNLLRDARLVVKGDVTKTKTFGEGRVRIQDEGSQLIALLAGRGERILDCCAAPGGKTLLIAERNRGARIVAVEKNPKRAAALRERVRGTKVEVVTADAREFKSEQGFDRVLVDAPCSGTGTLGRNPEIKWRLTPKCFAEFAREQRDILNAAIEHVAPGGRLVYSTCSLEREENEEVIAGVLAGRSDARLLHVEDFLSEMHFQSGELVYKDFDLLVRGEFLRTLPGVHPCDGFFAAVIEKVV